MYLAVHFQSLSRLERPLASFHLAFERSEPRHIVCPYPSCIAVLGPLILVGLAVCILVFTFISRFVLLLAARKLSLSLLNHPLRRRTPGLGEQLIPVYIKDVGTELGMFMECRLAVRTLLGG